MLISNEFVRVLRAPNGITPIERALTSVCSPFASDFGFSIAPAMNELAGKLGLIGTPPPVSLSVLTCLKPILSEGKHPSIPAEITEYEAVSAAPIDDASLAKTNGVSSLVVGQRVFARSQLEEGVVRITMGIGVALCSGERKVWSHPSKEKPGCFVTVERELKVANQGCLTEGLNVALGWTVTRSHRTFSTTANVAAWFSRNGETGEMRYTSGLLPGTAGPPTSNPQMLDQTLGFGHTANEIIPLVRKNS